MNIDRLAEEYLKTQELITTATSRKEEMKKMLMKYVEDNGSTDAQGHQWLPGDEFLLKRERRKGQVVFDEKAAREWAAEQGILDDLLTTVTPAPYTYFDEDKLAAWAFEHKDAEPTVKGFYNESDPTWAFAKPVKQKGYDY
jgi:hypothetical protein